MYYCCCLASKSCWTLCDPNGYSLPGPSVHGISQARILELVAISFSNLLIYIYFTSNFSLLEAAAINIFVFSKNEYPCKYFYKVWSEISVYTIRNNCRFFVFWIKEKTHFVLILHDLYVTVDQAKDMPQSYSTSLIFLNFSKN